MQNRPNRCRFAMTDFGAGSSLGHISAALSSYRRTKASFPQKCSTWNIMVPLAKCSTWNTLEQSDANLFAGWARGMFHVEHFLGSARKIEICSTWNTSRNLENRLACKMVVVTQNKHPSHLRPFQTRYWIAVIANEASSIALYSTCYFLGSTSPLCNLKLSLRGDSRFAGGDCQDAGRGQGDWDGGLPCKA